MKEFAKSSYYEGMTIGEIWGYKIDGLFQTDEEAAAYSKAVDNSYVCKNIFVTAVGDYKGLQAGDPRFVDIDGSGRIDDGEKLPTIAVTWSSSVTKNPDTSTTPTSDSAGTA